MGGKKLTFKKKSIIYKGYLYNDSFLNILKKIFLIKDKKKFIKELDGLFAFIVKDDNNIIACVDKISSIPIFYQKETAKILISNKSNLIQKFKKNDLLMSSLSSFFMSGYTIGNSTVFKTLKVLKQEVF